MKNIYIIILSTLMLVSCSSDDGKVISDFPFSIDDLNPSLPSLIYPTKNLICTNFNLEFEWNRSITFNRNSVVYIIDIAVDESFAEVLFKAKTSETNIAFNLEKGTTYFWRMKAIDEKGYESRYTSTQTFFTEPEAGINNVPYSPKTISPISGAVISGTEMTLDWDATDSDGDPLLFDLYYGESNPPQLVAENIDVSTFDVITSPKTTYYWRVVVKDNQQGISIGRVWNFRTQ